MLPYCINLIGRMVDILESKLIDMNHLEMCRPYSIWLSFLCCRWCCCWSLDNSVIGKIKKSPWWWWRWCWWFFSPLLSHSIQFHTCFFGWFVFLFNIHSHSNSHNSFSANAQYTFYLCQVMWWHLKSNVRPHMCHVVVKFRRYKLVQFTHV